MHRLYVPEREGLNQKTNEFITTKPCILRLEHSLIAISKWESKWHKPFLSGEKHTTAEMRDYVRCMCLDSNVDENVFKVLNAKEIMEILEYIDDPMTGTTFGKQDDEEQNHEIMSSELLYYYMLANDVPFECEKWHINRLLTLLKICGIKNKAMDTKPKHSKSELLQKYAAIHAAKKKAKK